MVRLLRGLVFVCLVAGSAGAGPKMLKGPYLQDLAPTSITVMWQFDELVPAKLIVEGPGGQKVQDVAPGRIAEATVEGLAPSTRYRYRVEAVGQTWQGEFATAPPTGKDVPFSFIVVGDTRESIEQHRRVV